jgi:hypothetical protein
VSLKYGVLSLLAFIIILLLIFKNYETWTLPAEVVPAKEPVKKLGAKIENPPATEQKEPAPVQSYILISQKNIFSPERKEFPFFLDPSKEVQKPIVRPQIILYGVTIVGDYQAASVSNPGRPLRKGERELMTVKIGENIGDYKLAKIMSDRITMEASGDTFDVMLYTPKQRIYAKTESKPATITSTLPTPPAGAPTPPQATAGTPQQPIQGSIAQAPMPRPVTPAPIPSPRTRRWFGPAPSTEAPTPTGPGAPAEE